MTYAMIMTFKDGDRETYLQIDISDNLITYYDPGQFDRVLKTLRDYGYNNLTICDAIHQYNKRKENSNAKDQTFSI